MWETGICVRLSVCLLTLYNRELRMALKEFLQHSKESESFQELSREGRKLLRELRRDLKRELKRELKGELKRELKRESLRESSREAQERA